MIYVVMAEIGSDDIDDNNDHYRYVRCFSKETDAIIYARKLAKKEGGLPERFIFTLKSKTAVPAPTEVEIIPVA